MIQDSPNVSRRCLVHYEYGCKAEICLADEVDLATNPDRPRPQPTPGAPEVSRGVYGIPHPVVHKEKYEEASASGSPALGLIAGSSILLPDTGTALARLTASVMTNPTRRKVS